MKTPRSRLSSLLRWAAIGVTALWVAGAHATAPASPPGALQAPAGAPASHAPMTDIHDIKPLVHLRGDFAPWAYGLIAAAGLALVGLALVYLRRRTGKTVSPGSPALPPEKAALQQLEAIRDVGDGRSFYFRLSAILRTYLEGRFGLNAPDMTTEELLPRVGAIGLAEDLAGRLEALLLSADPIKFAAAPASRRQMETDLDFAFAFVERTTATASQETEQAAVQNHAPE